MAKQKPLVIGIAGGSGSGKTTVSKEISKRLPADRVLILTEDAYYNDNSALSMDERKKINYDHPNAYDTDLLIEQLQDLLDGKAIEMPTYNFNILSRAKDTIHVEPADIIILEGILVLASEELRKFMDIKLFVDADDDIRFIRRLQRDTQERGRSIDWIISQYLATVKPSYNQFVEPSKKYADIIIPQGGGNQVAIDMVSSKLLSIING
ncbi:uridine kinase [Lactobacillus delbrueckii subsp. lactis]|jgi:uridine kinase|uniref:uridine kinase n=1 Tax=Lactobacillus delbrueckii TaxID=1584 RepID=UPI0001EC2F9C|nr:uridine kinase [Lactobacillus delbrueckii]ADQ60508.1 Uridine kinase [Lactobacillus delbrueckii subsp. bulgaricus ND02]APG72906.1 uridine kinase [Lactobacillus delbrueckii subsp. jakobsenii ZN7a-9 = DSM 26046]EOD03058.1 uridine kinase [Lactobacillus delbrueckii subsp. jakobsenii ZN7a-9 = DSM 26046]KRO19862.1 uridine kinase [Lactobacillus delbrueckii subsp. jakobsenii ZN7a-9 = DSM 26046]MBM6986905.1 uridine kinase [Lactobacillus delbrueckii]